MTKALLLIALLASSLTLNATVTIALLDSGVDFEHPKLRAHKWINEREEVNSKDDDANGYIDDVIGWDFINMRPNNFDNSLSGSFDKQIFKYYKLRANRSLYDNLTKEEKEWYAKKLKDEEFKKEKKKFKSFIHGTHIAGILVSKKSSHLDLKLDDIKIMSIKYLGSAKKGPAKSPDFTPLEKANQHLAIKHIESYLKRYERWQLNKLELAIKYASKNAQVVNGSFGQSYKKALSFISEIYEKQFKKLPSDELKHKLTKKLLSALILGTEKIAKKYSNLLYVFSAGNSKNNNDDLWHYPSNARAKNILSVGASKQFSEFAYFSNFGVKTVDILAPGIAIESTIPGDGKIQVNGTSQATPYVASVAAKLFLIAKNNGLKLTSAQVSDIIKLTSTKKIELNNKVSTGGIINPDRAFYVVKSLKNTSKAHINKIVKKSYGLINL